MRAAGARLRTLPAAALVASGCSLTPVPGCDQLHTQEFFAWADTPRVTSCLRQGADVTAHDPDGNTALHWAARYTDRPAIVTALVKAGADLDARTTADSSTALHLAARYSDHPAVIAALASAGAPLETRNENGATPLHSAAAYNQNPAIITALATAGADMEARLSDGNGTALHAAAYTNQSPAITIPPSLSPCWRPARTWKPAIVWAARRCTAPRTATIPPSWPRCWMRAQKSIRLTGSAGPRWTAPVIRTSSRCCWKPAACAHGLTSVRSLQGPR